MKNGVAAAGALLLLVLVRPALATDIWGVRASGGAAFGPDRIAFSTMAGATYEFFVDGFGLRGAADLGYLGYPRGGRDGKVALGIEVAAFVGPDGARFRPYLVVQPILSASQEVFEGLRLGPEIEWRDICASHLRIALGAFYAPTRAADGLSWSSFGPRLTITWGKPTLGCVEVPSCVPLPGQPCPPS